MEENENYGPGEKGSHYPPQARKELSVERKRSEPQLSWPIANIPKQALHTAGMGGRTCRHLGHTSQDSLAGWHTQQWKTIVPKPCLGAEAKFINHKNIERFYVGLEGTLRDHLVPTPCLGKGHLALEHFPLNPMQQLNTFRDVTFHSLSWQPIPVLHRPHSKEFLPKN